LLDVLKVCKFDELKQHLDALVALYNIDGDKYVFITAVNQMIITNTAAMHSLNEGNDA